MTELADFHVHPNYSIDATGTIRQFCDRALEVGLRHLCFTTHYDVNPRRTEQDGYWRYEGKRILISDRMLDIYFAEINRSRVFYEQFGLHIYRGLEIDYFPGVEADVERLRAKFPIDFAILSVHCLNDIAISDKREAPAYFLNKTVGEMADDYFSLLRQAAACPGYDSLGHLDYYVRYGRNYYGDEIDRIEIERFDEVFAFLRGGASGIELNTSPYRYGSENFHPGQDMLARAIKAGVEVISVGSDSHHPEKFGLGLKHAYDLLRQLDIEPKFPLVK